MKKIKALFLLIAVFSAINVALAQAPNQFKYQAVLRDASGNIIPNAPETIIVNILMGSSNGGSVYQETQNVTTTAQGIINFNIGAGTVNSGNFSTIAWGSNPYWVKITLNGLVISNAQLLSVPYCLYSAASASSQWLNSAGSAIYYPTGNVGIGTNSPINLLHLVNPADRTNITVESSSPNFGPELHLKSTATGGHEWRIVSGASASNSYGVGSFELYDAGVGLPRFGILANGNVGIGTVTPFYKLEVNGTINATSVLVNGVAVVPGGNQWTTSGSNIFYNSGNVGIGTTAPVYPLHVAGGGIKIEANPDAYVTFGLNSGDAKQAIGQFNGWDPTMLYLNPRAHYADGVMIGSTSNNTRSALYVYGPTGSAALTVDGGNGTAIYVKNGGDVRFVPQISGGETFLFNDDGRQGMTNIGPTYAGTAYMNGSGWTFASDIRLKENIVTLDNALAKVLQLRGVYYNYKINPGRKDIGVIAQEVQKQFPELVNTDSKGYLGVSYEKLTAVLIEAVKDLNAKVVKLEQANAALTVENNDLKTLRAEVDGLKNSIQSLQGYTQK